FTYKGVTPLFIAAQEGYVDAIVKLVELGANVNTPMNNGETTVYIAAQNGHLDAAAKLIGFGANLEFLNQNLENISSLV
ncbi:MAG: ankyrin repeat domain-containing protein, partial [Alphaproteobacteria bacterium]|nr:ankyrin repeat domain-containing protein [Alphaproteobacteria bacterium]